MHKLKRLILNLKRFKRFLKRLKLEPVHLFFPSALAISAAAFEGATLFLLLPTIRGLVESNFEFAYSVKGLGAVFAAFPSVFSNHDAAIFTFLVVLILIFALLKNAASYFSSFIVTHQVRRLSHELRCLLFDSYISFKKSFFDKNSTGHLQNILIGYTEQIATQFKTFQHVLYHFFVLFAYLMIMATISWRVTVFVMLLFPFMIFAFKKLVGQIRVGSRKFSTAFSLLGKKIMNSLSCIPLVKASVSEEKEKKWFQHVSDEVRKQQLAMDIRDLLISPIQEVFFLCCFLVLTGFMAYLAIRHREGNVASYLVFFLVVRRAMQSMGLITAFQGNIASIVGPLRQVMRVFEERKTHAEQLDGSQITSFSEQIEFRNLSFSYYDRNVISSVSLQIKKGQMVALVGRTGSGKSTLTQLLLRFYDPPEESVFVDGKDILDLEIKSWRKKIAFVSQENYFFDASIEVNLKYGCENDPSPEEMLVAIEKAQLGDFVKKFPDGIGTEIGERGVQLSGGEKQRLALARAILREPEILILDEATSALDSQTEELVQRAILEAVKGKTSIIIAHRLSTIQKADVIFVLDNGVLVEQGSFSELIQSQGSFKLFWDSQRQRD